MSDPVRGGWAVSDPVRGGWAVSDTVKDGWAVSETVGKRLPLIDQVSEITVDWHS